MNKPTYDELAAQVEQLRNASYAAVMFIKNGVALGFIRMPDNDVPDPAHRTLPNLCAALDATPAQCLAEVRAQAVEDFVDGSIKHFSNNDYKLNSITIKYYLDIHVRQQAKVGE